MQFPTEKLQVFADGLFDLSISRQRATITHAEPLCGLDLREAVIVYALFDNNPGSFLRENLSCALVTICLPFRHRRRGVLCA